MSGKCVLHPPPHPTGGLWGMGREVCAAGRGGGRESSWRKSADASGFCAESTPLASPQLNPLAVAIYFPAGVGPLKNPLALYLLKHRYDASGMFKNAGGEPFS